MKCPKYGYEINDALKASYCKNCDIDCVNNNVPWFSNFKFEIPKSERENAPAKPDVILKECSYCRQMSLYVYPNGINVTCLNKSCEIYNAPAIMVKDGKNVTIQIIN